MAPACIFHFADAFFRQPLILYSVVRIVNYNIQKVFFIKILLFPVQYVKS